MQTSENHEKKILFFLALAQFINVLEFMMVQPLGPDFASDLGIPLSKLGMIGSSYTFAAAIFGILGIFVLGRFERKKAFAWMLTGLAFGTMLAAFAQGEKSLVAARVLAGMTGGPATALSQALIADYIPVERRGRAMGVVMGSFAIASILGVPLSLELSRFGGWRASFLCVGVLVFIVAMCVHAFLPKPEKQNSSQDFDFKILREAFAKPKIWMAYVTSFISMMSGFLIIPNLAAYIQGNMHFPRESMSLLYLAGGALTFFTMRLAGKIVDIFGSARLITFTSFSLVAFLWIGFYKPQPWFNPWILFLLFMPILSSRNVALQTLNSKVPQEKERSPFMSALSTVNHVGSSLGAYASSKILTDASDGTLSGMPSVAMIAMIMALLMVPFVWMVERLVLLSLAQAQDQRDEMP